ncbi:hypothetical protein TELCIR_03516 [Teladorsagia circumcincta]|uniref:7TM GPCR serpentine receptor class x (Srx) domain-containing protein n=1 Tax=Teladorsagia circumcincta TaxID=45464 RepID=A0A2G9UW49_TELCI|nr:hypothetical protein TELCIR_03516 [Teladorsagia circumcincta]
MWLYGTEPCARFLAGVDIYYNGSLIAILSATDIVTMVQLKLRRKTKTSGARAQAAARQRRKEFLFSAQTAVNSSTYPLLYIAYYSATFMVDMKLPLFLCTTLAWAMLHSIAGVLFVKNYTLQEFVLKMAANGSITVLPEETQEPVHLLILEAILLFLSTHLPAGSGSLDSWVVSQTKVTAYGNNDMRIREASRRNKKEFMFFVQSIQQAPVYGEFVSQGIRERKGNMNGVSHHKV